MHIVRSQTDSRRRLFACIVNERVTVLPETNLCFNKNHKAVNSFFNKVRKKLIIVHLILIFSTFCEFKTTLSAFLQTFHS
jgi:hypothetical protein